MFGYKETDGLMTDIEQLKEQGLNVSCVNLSCGYYEPHTDNEYTDKKDLLNCLRFIEHIITNCKKTYRHEAEYDERAYLNFAYSSWDIYDELFESSVKPCWLTRRSPRLTSTLSTARITHSLWMISPWFTRMP